MIYNSFIEPNNVTTDSYFLRYEFTEAMLDALGIKDYTGVIYELVNYRYFEDDMLGDWDSMIDGMINVSADAVNYHISFHNILSCAACRNFLHKSLDLRVHEVQLPIWRGELLLLV